MRKPILSDEDKRFIDKNAGKLPFKKIGEILGCSTGTVYMYYSRQREKKPARPKAKCNPPQDCFNCPYPDCIRTNRRVTKAESQMREIGDITTVGVKLT